MTRRPIAATDDELKAILRDADVPALLPALAFCTGDMTLLRPELRPDGSRFGTPHGGLTDEQQEAVRELAADTLARYRDAGSQPAPIPCRDELQAIMEFTVGARDLGPYVDLVLEEFAYGGSDLRAPRWHKDDAAPGRDFNVLIIGAGMSGLLAAHRLAQAGVAYRIVEKNSDVGGTWLENAYPGCRVDNPTHSYSYSFAQREDWTHHYSTQPTLHSYFSSLSAELDIRSHIEFDTEVVRLEWCDRSATWTALVRRRDGGTETFVASAVVAAVGQLNNPSYPESISGFGSFEGDAWHTARWRRDVSLAGKRVGVIGTGASAMQVVPEIAPEVGELVVFQRTPSWLGPTADYHAPVGEGHTWLCRHVPSYAQWVRFCTFWRLGDGALESVRVDPAYEGGGSAVSAANAQLRAGLERYLRSQFASRPDLVDKVIPTYPPGAKRIIRDNGSWAAALTRDNVTLEVGPIEEVTPTGVRTAGGHHDLDVLIYGTGFKASDFLGTIDVIGRDGQSLHDVWKGDARAYLGVTIPGFPNLWCLYGPNTNIVINGSIIFFSECGVRYILGLIELLLQRSAGAVDIRAEVHEEFNGRVDEGNRAMAWGAANVNSWYRNAHGRISQNWPFTLLEYWERTARPEPKDYVVTACRR